jgi:hypothetical protein
MIRAGDDVDAPALAQKLMTPMLANVIKPAQLAILAADDNDGLVENTCRQIVTGLVEILRRSRIVPTAKMDGFAFSIEDRLIGIKPTRKRKRGRSAVGDAERRLSLSINACFTRQVAPPAPRDLFAHDAPPGIESSVDKVFLKLR